MKLEEAKKVVQSYLRLSSAGEMVIPSMELDEAMQVLLDYADEGREGRTTHDLKLSLNFCDPVYNGLKTFELRKNDRGYQTGDLIRFTPIKFDESDPVERYPDHPIRSKLYEITYIISGWGLQPDCVALGIREVTG